MKKKSSRPLSSTLSNVWSSFRGLSSIDSTEKDQDTEDELFFKDLYASSWMQRIFTRTRRLSQKMSKLRAIKHDMSKQALIDRLCMGYMDLENKRVRVLIQGPFLQIYEAGQDFRSRFPLYVTNALFWNILQYNTQIQHTHTHTQIQLQGRRRQETCRTILTERICCEIELCGGVSSSSRVSTQDSNRTTLEWCWSGDTYQGHSREVLEEVCT